MGGDIFEDIDTIIKAYGDEDLLSFLDGEIQVDTILNIATSNYPEDLDKRITARPRRFDKLERIDNPSQIMRKEYFIKKLQLTESELKKWVDISEGFSFAGLTDLIIGVKCLGNDLDEYANRIKKIIKGTISSTEYKIKTGFNAKEEI